ncbi:MAG: carboxymuconolactone decarboxylase family protein [Rickettsiales bacterium]|nr:carboxymuconolactone decarboxylase family protein [Rickettsiales bacterium]
MENLESLKSLIPDYAKDVKINLQTLLNSQNQLLTQNQIFGAALSCAFAIKEKTLIKILQNEVQNILSEAEITAVKSSAILMAMNNIYYRFVHISSDKEYSQMPAGLRMRGIVEHGIDKIDFEIFSLAVSIINGCGMCIDAHSKQLLQHGLNKSQIQAVAKIAAVVNSAAQILIIESKNNL